MKIEYIGEKGDMKSNKPVYGIYSCEFWELSNILESEISITDLDQFPEIMKFDGYSKILKRVNIREIVIFFYSCSCNNPRDFSDEDIKKFLTKPEKVWISNSTGNNYKDLLLKEYGPFENNVYFVNMAYDN